MRHQLSPPYLSLYILDLLFTEFQLNVKLAPYFSKRLIGNRTLLTLCKQSPIPLDATTIQMQNRPEESFFETIQQECKLPRQLKY